MVLEEIQHHIANSLQIIANILILKARSVQSEETRLQLEGAITRLVDCRCSARYKKRQHR